MSGDDGWCLLRQIDLSRSPMLVTRNNDWIVASFQVCRHPHVSHLLSVYWSKHTQRSIGVLCRMNLHMQCSQDSRASSKWGLDENMIRSYMGSKSCNKRLLVAMVIELKRVFEMQVSLRSRRLSFTLGSALHQCHQNEELGRRCQLIETDGADLHIIKTYH
jgi:hypothetical protein